jgi:hypothetical protein
MRPDVLPAETMKTTLFGDIVLCSLIEMMGGGSTASLSRSGSHEGETGYRCRNRGKSKTV